MCGLLWWLIPEHEHYLIDDAKLAELRGAGVSDDLLRPLQPLLNRPFGTRRAYYRALADALGPTWIEIVDREVNRKGLRLSHRTIGAIIGVKADGWLGQYVVVLPAPRLVAVRLIRNTPGYNAETDMFADFEDRVRALVG